MEQGAQMIALARKLLVDVQSTLPGVKAAFNAAGADEAERHVADAIQSLARALRITCPAAAK